MSRTVNLGNVVGPQGPQGERGLPGLDGFSPIVEITKTDDTSIINITDKEGLHTTEVKDGVQYTAGENITIEDGVISASGGGSSAVQHMIMIKTNSSQLANDLKNAINSYITENNITGDSLFNVQDQLPILCFKGLDAGYNANSPMFGYIKINYTTSTGFSMYLTPIAYINSASAASAMYAYNVSFNFTYENNQIVSLSVSNGGIKNVKTNYLDYNYLSKTNTSSFTPTGDYNPATKKYVDDQVGSINTVLATLTTVSEVTE